MHPDESAIRALHDTWMDAVNAGDLARLLPLMADDVVFLSPGQPPTGRDHFEQVFSGGHRQFELRCVSELQEVVVAGAVAHSYAKDSLSLLPRGGGERLELAGYRLTVYRKQADGRWLLARDAHTLVPAGA